VETTLAGLGYEFNDPELLQRALTHRSWGKPNQERLEFLGDGVLNMLAAEMLFEHKPDAPEGDLSRYRTRMVRGETLARIAAELNLGDHIRLGAGELKSGGFRRESILEDALEAIIGAIYLDSGLDECRQLVGRLWAKTIAELPEAEDLKDPKTQLQEWLQARGQQVPAYRVLSAEGPDHARIFTVECAIDIEHCPLHIGTGESRRKAEQAAAKLAIGVLIPE
jgi:ribonuclease-3